MTQVAVQQLGDDLCLFSQVVLQFVAAVAVFAVAADVAQRGTASFQFSFWWNFPATDEHDSPVHACSFQLPSLEHESRPTHFYVDFLVASRSLLQ